MKELTKIEYSERALFEAEFNSHKTMIIATMGLGFFENETEVLIEKLIRYGITHIRVNLSKFDTPSSLVNLTHMLNNIKNTFNIMLDLPIPFKKIRFSLANKNAYLDVKKGEILNICYCNNMNNKKTLYIQEVNVSFWKCIHEGDIIKYGDGECELVVQKVQANCITAEVQNSVRIFAKKSLNFDNYILDNHTEIVENKYTNLLKEVNPWAVAFSFISSKQDVLQMKQYLDNVGIEPEIVSKIETNEGVKNILEILEVSNVMLARGDLSLNVPVEKFYDTQQYVFEKVASSGKKIYIATGILNSLSSLNMPTQAEIIDISIILKNNPDGIVLNYGVIQSSGLNKALDIIHRIEYK